MATLSDILTRTAAGIGMETGELAAYAETLMTIVEECHRRGESVELMTFGTLDPPESTPRFRPHATLFASGSGEMHTERSDA